MREAISHSIKNILRRVGSRYALYATSIVVNIGPPMSNMSLLSVSMHLSFKHQPVINQALLYKYENISTLTIDYTNKNPNFIRIGHVLFGRFFTLLPGVAS